MQRMFLRAKKLLAFLVALQLPLCCCEVRAAIAAIAHASHEVAGAVEVDACCAIRPAAPCCSEDLAGSAAPVCADGEAGHNAPQHEPCCADCADRSAPTLAALTDADVSTMTLNFVASVMLAATEPAFGCAPSGRFGGGVSDGPPRAPSGRFALAMHSVLVI